MAQNLTPPANINWMQNDRKFTSLWTYLKNLSLLINNPKPNLYSSLPLPSSSLQGLLVVVSDSTVNTFGSTILGGGTYTVLAWCNGTNWTVIGI